MKHPLKKCQDGQAEYLKSCPKKDRVFHEYIFRVGNASYIYHQKATKSLDESTLKSYYKEWLEGLPINISKDMEKRGYEACKTMFPFTRYVNECSDIGMDAWMKEHLSVEDYNEWIKTKSI